MKRFGHGCAWFSNGKNNSDPGVVVAVGKSFSWKSQEVVEEIVPIQKNDETRNPHWLPLHKVPFNSLAIAAIDLPESFFRAINYGDKYANALERTICFLLTTEKDTVSLSYSMLTEAIARYSVDAVNIILREGGKRGFSKH
jgi:hypothetical protein